MGVAPLRTDSTTRAIRPVGFHPLDEGRQPPDMAIAWMARRRRGNNPERLNDKPGMGKIE